MGDGDAARGDDVLDEEMPALDVAELARQHEWRRCGHGRPVDVRVVGDQWVRAYTPGGGRFPEEEILKALEGPRESSR